MNTFYSWNQVDWDNILGHLKHGEAIKIYFHNSLETLMVGYANNLLLIQNSTDEEAMIHNLKNIGIELNGNLLEVLIDTSLFENHVSGVSLIETMDLRLTLIDFD